MRYGCRCRGILRSRIRAAAWRRGGALRGARVLLICRGRAGRSIRGRSRAIRRIKLRERIDRQRQIDRRRIRRKIKLLGVRAESQL